MLLQILNNKKSKYNNRLTKFDYEKFNDFNIEFFENAKMSLLDPLGHYVANDVNWINLDNKWNSLKFH